MTLKAIETQYKGYRFRSRLEARWAVTLDELGLVYEYELEGYELPSKKRYLPDFYLPEYGMYVEVKPTVHIAKSEIEKLAEFCSQADGCLLFIAGTPTTQQMWILGNEFEERLAEFSRMYASEVADSDFAERCLQKMVEVRLAVDAARPGKYQFVYSESNPYEKWKIDEALEKGKGARFEFGESG